MALARENLSICVQDGEGSNDDNNNLAFPRGGPERGNPAMTTKRLRQGVKETHQHKCCGKKHSQICVVFDQNFGGGI